MPVPSADHLAEILNDLYHDREKLKAIGMACKERALDPMYQWDTIAANFEEVFDEVLEEKVDTEQAA